MVVSEEEKKAGIWEYNEVKFKRCIGCKKPIPAEWKSHQCGWGKEAKPEEPKLITSEKETGLIATAIVSESIKEAIDVLNNQFPKTKEQEVYYNIDHVLQVADQIRRTKFMLRFRHNA